MPDEVDDLWPSEIVVDVLSPLMILKQQAEAIAKRTGRIVIGDVTRSWIDDKLKEICFDVIAPAIGYRERILTVRHTHDRPYPALLMTYAFIVTDISVPPLNVSPDPKFWNLTTEAEIRNSRFAHSPTEFKSILRQIFNSPTTVSLLLSLIARSNELAPQSPPPSEPVK